MLTNASSHTADPTPEGWRRVEEHNSEVHKGMSADQVISILGTPNEITPLYEPEHFRPRTIGRTFVYAKTKFVPPRETRPNWFRVDFDLQGRVDGVRKEGL
jgi:hypothetical protein